MKKTILSLSAAALVLAGCAGLPTAETTVIQREVITVTPEAERAPAETKDEKFIRLLVGQDSAFASAPAGDLIEVAGTICELLDDGFTPTYLGEVAMEAGLDMQQAAALVAASIVVYCPWNESRV